jgi:hypothetical protein
MRKIILMMSISVDGFIEGPNRELDWQMIDEELHSHFNDQLRPMGAFLEGRVTHELMARTWSTIDTDPSSIQQARERELLRPCWSSPTSGTEYAEDSFLQDPGACRLECDHFSRCHSRGHSEAQTRARWRHGTRRGRPRCGLYVARSDRRVLVIRSSDCYRARQTTISGVTH